MGRAFAGGRRQGTREEPAAAAARPSALPGTRVAALVAVALVAVALVAAVVASAGQGPAPLPALRADTVPLPGQVGYRGDLAALRVIDGPEDAPAGTRWVPPGFLQIDADDLVLDHVLVRGGLDWYGGGTLTVRDSVVEGGAAWMVVNARAAGAHLELQDSTLRWPARTGPPHPGWGNGAVHGNARMTVARCDISGTPDGIQNAAGGSVFEQNHIHDLLAFGEYPDNTHNDGIQLYGGPGIEVRHNRIDLGPFDGVHQNAAVFLQPGQSGALAPRIVGNYLRGGGYVLRLEAGTRDAVVTGNVFGPAEGAFGHAVAEGESAVAQWAGNLDASGSVVPPPVPGTAAS